MNKETENNTTIDFNSKDEGGAQIHFQMVKDDGEKSQEAGFEGCNYTFTGQKDYDLIWND